MSDSQKRHDPTEPRESTESRDAGEQRDPTEQQEPQPTPQGGFGAFSRQYRDRWAANHPNSRRIHGDATSRGAPPSEAAEAPADLADLADHDVRDGDGGSDPEPG